MTTRGLVVFTLAVGVMVVAGAAFGHKMLEFVLTMSGDRVAGFGAAAICTYVAGMLPLLLLTLWAVVTGRFRDIEAPAFRMLELDNEIEREEARRAHVVEPITAPPNRSPAEASRPDQPLDGRFHTYEPNPVPWWVTVLWIAFLVFGVTYLLVQLTRG